MFLQLLNCSLSVVKWQELVKNVPLEKRCVSRNVPDVEGRAVTAAAKCHDATTDQQDPRT